MLYFPKAEEGTKEGDDKGVPPISQRGEEVMTSGLLGHACEATSASRPARPGGRAGPAVGSVRGLGASWADSVAWAGMAVGELGQGDGQATS